MDRVKPIITARSVTTDSRGSCCSESKREVVEEVILDMGKWAGGQVSMSLFAFLPTCPPARPPHENSWLANPSVGTIRSLTPCQFEGQSHPGIRMLSRRTRWVITRRRCNPSGTF